MPRDRKRKTNIGQHTEEEMRAALVKVSEGQKLRAVARTMNIPYTTLYRYNEKIKNSSSHDPIATEKLTPNYSVRKIFTEVQEKDMFNYIKRCSNMFYGLTLFEKKRGRTERRKGKSMIATDTPNKNEIEKRAEEKNSHKRKKTAKAVKKKILESDSEEEEDRISLYSEEKPMMEEDDEIIHVDPTHFRSLQGRPKEGNFILVEFKPKEKKVYYIAKVIGDKNDIEVSFLRKSVKNPNKFHVPNVPDIATVALQDIKMVLPQPGFSGSTKRTQGLYHFDVDFSNINLR